MLATFFNISSIISLRIENKSILLIFSPIGEVFRARIRQFPALVNCSTIDWFCPWPEAALQVRYVIFFFAIHDILRSIINGCDFISDLLLEIAFFLMINYYFHNNWRKINRIFNFFVIL